MKAKKLLKGLPLSLQFGTAPLSPTVAVTDVVTRAEDATSTSLFVCTQTVLKNGHYDAPVAYSRGCRLFLAERGLALPPDATVLICENTKNALGPLSAKCYKIPRNGMQIAGVTGTYGKSTVIRQGAKALRALGYKVGTITTDGVEYEGEYTPAGPTAPDAADIHRTLFSFYKAGAEIALVEYSAYQLQNGAAEGTEFTATLLTNLTPHHIGRGFHRTYEEYETAKAALFEERTGHTVLPREHQHLHRHGKLTTFGAETANITAKDIAPCMNGNGAPAFSFTLSNFAKSTPIVAPVATSFGVENTLAVAALLHALGVASKKMGNALSLAAPHYRAECVLAQDERLVFVDTAYTGEDAEKVLRALRPLVKNRLSVVLGSVGGRARDRRAPLGAAALSYADFCFFTADDADFESPLFIIDDMLGEHKDSLHYRIIPDREAAIHTAVNELRRGDVLLVLGKAAPYQLKNGQCLPFDDVETVKRAYGHTTR